MSAVATRFCCPCPLSDFEESFIVFFTLEFQQLNKLIESKVRNLSAPDSLHTVKVKCFCNDSIKASAKVGCNFPLPVKALISNFPIVSCELSDSPIPVVRTLYLSTDSLMQFAELFQGSFQELGGLNLFTCAERQKCFQSKVYPYVLTCSGKGFGRNIICDDIELVLTVTITEYLYIADISVPVAVLVKREPKTIEF